MYINSHPKQLFVKVLSSEMIRLSLGSFDRYLFKREERRFFVKPAPPPSCESLLKISRHFVQLLTIGMLTANTAMKFINSLRRRDRKNVVHSQVSSRSCQYRGAFIAPLPISLCVRCAIAYREKQHSGF